MELSVRKNSEHHRNEYYISITHKNKNYVTLNKISLFYYNLRNNDVKTLVGIVRLFGVELFEMGGDSHRLGSGMCITQHRRTYIQAVNLRFGKSLRPGQGVTADATTHVQDSAGLLVRVLFLKELIGIKSFTYGELLEFNTRSPIL